MRQEDFDKFNRYMELMHFTIYHEPSTPNFHNRLIDKVLDEMIFPLDLPKDAVILDMGCGSGYFLSRMKETGFYNLRGITMDDEDIAECKALELDVSKQDMTFTDLPDGELDLLFCRHCLEHSPFPSFTLLEFNRLLKVGGHLYIEVPAPNQDRKHENNLNHYSIMGEKMWNSLFSRACFNIDKFDEFQFNLTDEIAPGIMVDQIETFYIYKLTKTQNIFGNK